MIKALPNIPIMLLSAQATINENQPSTFINILQDKKINIIIIFEIIDKPAYGKNVVLLRFKHFAEYGIVNPNININDKSELVPAIKYFEMSDGKNFTAQTTTNTFIIP